jgi:hypothetical protein
MSKPVFTAVGALALVAAATVGGVAFLLLLKPPPPGPASGAAPDASVRPALSYDWEPIGFPITGHPLITHVAIADLDQDGLQDVIVCDAAANRIGWIRQFPRGVFKEQFIGDPVSGPAHVSVCDLNGTGRLDLLVASMGQILPNNDRIGKIIVLENLGDGRFRNHVIAENIARVTDVRGVDLAGHGRKDLVVGQYGYTQGELQWMENLGDWKFAGHPLLDLAGTIMTPTADFDGDGKPDIAAFLSQDTSQVYGQVHLFRNLGDGKFRDTILWQTTNLDYGGSGMTMGDVNGDGRPDLIVSNGDGFNSAFAAPAPWHGLQWLENQGDGRFAYHRVGDSLGCYSPVAADLRGRKDGHLDLVSVSAFNNSLNASSIALTAWLNDGHENFTPVVLAHQPTWMVTLAAGDLDGNGIPVLVTGGFHAYPPYTQMSRVTLWRRK